MTLIGFYFSQALTYLVYIMEGNAENPKVAIKLLYAFKKISGIVQKAAGYYSIRA